MTAFVSLNFGQPLFNSKSCFGLKFKEMVSSYLNRPKKADGAWLL